MAHEVRLKIDTALVGKKDFEVVVRSTSGGRRGKLGTLLISKGNVEWLPRGNSVNKRRLSWVKFAEVMIREGRRTKKK